MKDENQLETVIAGLAILTSNQSQGKDYIDLFVPLVNECILTTKPNVISVTDLQAQIISRFGMQIPQNALKLVLQRAYKKGYLNRKEGIYRPNIQMLSTLDFSSRYGDVIKQINAVVDKLMRFAKENFSLDVKTNEAENALLALIQKHDIELLECSINQQPISIVTAKSTSKLDYIVNSYIREIYENDHDSFKSFEVILKGHFLSHTLFFPDLSQITKRFHLTEIFFDTALLLRLMGYEGSARRDSCKELINLLYKESAALKCFRHTREEAYFVLHSCMVDMQRGNEESTSPTFLYLKKMGYSPGDIQLELSLFDKKIVSLGIRIVEKPLYEDKFQIDELKLDKALEKETEYWREKPRQRKNDLDSLSAIYRLRRGHESEFFEDSIALFVTANSTLCKVSTKYFSDGGYIKKSSVPMAITDYALTALLWVKSPMLKPDLPSKFLIAECYAAVEPNERLWRKYLEIVYRLKEEDKLSSSEYYLLRYSQIAQNELMNLTMGDEDVISEGSIPEILEKVNLKIREKDLAELKRERGLRTEIENRLEQEKEVNRLKWDIIDQNLVNISRQISRVLSYIMLGFILLIISAGALYGIISLWGNLLNYILIAACIIFAIWTVLNLYNGFTIKKFIKCIEVWIFNRLYNSLNRIFIKK